MIDEALSIAGGAFEARQSFDPAAFGAKYGGVTISALSTGASLYRQGEASDALFYLQDGRVQITVVSSQGKEGILAVLDRGDFCGEGCLLANRVRVATAACITDSIVARLERTHVVRAIREDPAVAEFFVVLALTNVTRLREDLISQLFDSSEKRLARVLLVLARDYKGSLQDKVIRNADQEALAQMIGTTRSRVNYFMNKFRKLGCIDYDSGVILIHGSLLDELLHENSFDASEP